METIRFEDLELDAKIMRAITDMGFEAASPIQDELYNFLGFFSNHRPNFL